MILRFGDFELSAATRLLSRGGEPVHVEPKVLDLLILLAANRDRFVPRDELMDSLWPDAIVGEAALSRLVKEARRAVDDDGTRQEVLRTVHGRGFQFVAEVLPSNEHTAEPTPPDPDSTATAELTDSAGSGRRRFGRLGVRWVHPRRAVTEPPPPKGQRLIIGRANECDVVLEGNDASRKHAELFRDGPILALRDLDSKNGTFVNGERVRQSPLASGDVVRIGEWLGIVIHRNALEKSELNLVVDPVEGLLFGPELAEARKLATSDLSIVVQGETGTGKTVAAHAIHVWSNRDGPLITKQCTADTDGIELPQLDGSCGTLLLDDVNELTRSGQAALVRALEQLDRASRPDGAAPWRVIATTQTPLIEAVYAGRYRKDLLARLSGLTVELLPLRERIADVPGLFFHFLTKHYPNFGAEVSAKLLERLCVYDWPFNLKELELTARRLLALYEGESTLSASRLPAHIRLRDVAGATTMDRLRRALREKQGRIAPAAAALGLSRDAAYDLLKIIPPAEANGTGS